jgi:L-asparaginase II
MLRHDMKCLSYAVGLVGLAEKARKPLHLCSRPMDGRHCGFVVSSQPLCNKKKTWTKKKHVHNQMVRKRTKAVLRHSRSSSRPIGSTGWEVVVVV